MRVCRICTAAFEAARRCSIRRQGALERDAMVWYIRFQTELPSSHASWPLGIFRAANHLRDSDEYRHAPADWIEEVHDWFNKKLPVPPTDELDARAVFWFRPGATAFVHEAWRLVGAYREAGIWAWLGARADREESSIKMSIKLPRFPSEGDLRLCEQYYSSSECGGFARDSANGSKGRRRVISEEEGGPR